MKNCETQNVGSKIKFHWTASYLFVHVFPVASVQLCHSGSWCEECVVHKAQNSGCMLTGEHCRQTGVYTTSIHSNLNERLFTQILAA